MPLQEMNVNDLRLCWFGDSLVAGAGDPEGFGGAGRVGRAMLESGVLHCGYNCGICGETSAELSRRWLEEALRRCPREHVGRVVFSFGTNDARLLGERQLFKPEQTYAHARRIFKEAASRWPTLVIGAPPLLDAGYCERSEGAAAAIAAAARECEVPFLDLMTPLKASRVYMDDLAATDGVHPGATGYAQIARVVLGWSEWWYPSSAKEE